jgi:hypothetical protein
MLLASDIAFIEWHDGTVDAIIISPGEVVVSFGRVFVYRQKAPEQYSIENGPARLTLRGTRTIKFTGLLSVSSSEGWISDCDVECDRGPCDARMLQMGFEAGKIRMTLTNGTEFEADFAGGRLELLGTFDYVEDWNGPL